MRAARSAGARYFTLGAGTGAGTALTAANGAKSSYVTLGTAPWAAKGIQLQFTSASRACRFDLAINTGGADVIVAADVPIGTPVSNNQITNIYLPIRIPSGATIKIRALGRSATSVMSVLLQGFSFAPRRFAGGQRVISLTDWTTGDPTNLVTTTGQTYTAYTTIVASTSSRVSHMWIWALDGNDVVRTAGTFLLDIAIGAAASERVIATLLGINPTNGLQDAVYELPGNIPAGTRLSFRVRHVSGSSADPFGVAAVGLAA